MHHFTVRILHEQKCTTTNNENCNKADIQRRITSNEKYRHQSRVCTVHTTGTIQAKHDITVSKNRSSKSACQLLDLIDLYFLHVK